MNLRLDWLGRWPWWGRAIVAVACVVVGVVLTLRPFTSAAVLVRLAGVAAIVTGASALTADDERSTTPRRIVGIGWIVIGVVALARPGLGVDWLATIVGAALLVDGVVDVGRAFRSAADERVTAAFGGAATAVVGVLAVVWPDATVFVVAVLFGVRTAWFGLVQLFTIVTRRAAAPAGHTTPSTEPRRGRLHRSMRLLSHGAALLLAIAVLAVSLASRRDSEQISTFYDAPDAVPGTPGELLRSEPLDVDLPPGAVGWRILYTSTDAEGESNVASAFVLAADDGIDRERPVVLWTHGTVGIARRCAPSMFTDVTVGIPAVAAALAAGWVLVAPDYPGMGTVGDTPYLIGPPEAHSALDAVRAARLLDGLTLGGQTTVWGHSQGGHVALWTGMVATTYAPDVPLAGVAALSPATDLVTLSTSLDGNVFGSVLAAYLISSYATAYDDVGFDDYVRPGARVQVREAARRCVTDPSLAISIVAGLGAETAAAVDPATGALGERLAENTPTAAVDAPVLIAHGTDDEVISPDITAEWVAEQCADDHPVEFRQYPDDGHLSLVDDELSALPGELVAWTAARFAGESASATC